MSGNVKSCISGVGAYLPDQIVNTVDLTDEVKPERFGIPNDFLTRVVGIKERRVADEHCKQSDMATMSAEIAMKQSGLSPKDIDCVIFCGIDGDCVEPATAHKVQNNLGTQGSEIFDVSNACNGFMTGLFLADTIIVAGRAEAVLVVTGERSTEVLFDMVDQLKACTDKEKFRNSWGVLTVGDAGGAMVVTKSDNGKGFIEFNSFADSKLAEMCHYRWNKHGHVDFQMLIQRIGKECFKGQEKLIDSTYEKLNWDHDDVDHLYAHQIGEKPHRQTAEVCGVPFEKASSTYGFLGNITTASIPVNMHLFPPAPGEKLLFMGTGSGLTIIQAGLVM